MHVTQAAHQVSRITNDFSVHLSELNTPRNGFYLRKHFEKRFKFTDFDGQQ